MKTTTILRFGIFLFFLLTISNVFAQKEFAFAASHGSYLKTNPADISSLEKLVADEKVSRKILKYFSKNFISSDEIHWEGVGENLLATSVSDDITTRTLFNNKGHFIYTIDYASEKILPSYIKTMVMKTYNKYEIISVAKILEANRKIWVVTLNGKNDVATVRVENGEMDEVEYFQKSH